MIITFLANLENSSTAWLRVRAWKTCFVMVMISRRQLLLISVSECAATPVYCTVPAKTELPLSDSTAVPPPETEILKIGFLNFRVSQIIIHLTKNCGPRFCKVAASCNLHGSRWDLLLQSPFLTLLTSHWKGMKTQQAWRCPVALRKKAPWNKGNRRPLEFVLYY